MNSKNAVVIVIDRLGSGYLGPYGNTWVETPDTNRLASEAVLFEQAVSDTPELELAYRSLWSGSHAMGPGCTAPAAELARLLASKGVLATLMTDESKLTGHPLAGGFPQIVRITSDGSCASAASAEETQIGQLMAAAAEWLHSAPTPFLLWLHSRGMNGSWDAPREFRQRFVDAEDPEPPDFVVPPDRKLPVQADPDEVLGVTQAYAGQLLALDICLGMFLQAFADSPLSRSTLLVLASPRGYALGEHGFIGSCGDQLCGEVLQVPLLVRFPDGFAAGQRFQTLVQPADLYATLCEWFALDGVTADWSRSLIALAKDESAWRRECACSLRPGQRSIRTAAWFLRESEFAPPALYAKPDDRWEMNEVASRCGEVVESLQAAVEMFRKAAESRQLGELPALPPISVGLAD